MGAVKLKNKEKEIKKKGLCLDERHISDQIKFSKYLLNNLPMVEKI